MNFTLSDRFLLLFHLLVANFLPCCKFWAALYLLSCRQLRLHPQKHNKPLNEILHSNAALYSLELTINPHTPSQPANSLSPLK